MYTSHYVYTHPMYVSTSYIGYGDIHRICIHIINIYETYICQKKPIYFQKDLYILKETCIY